MSSSNVIPKIYFNEKLLTESIDDLHEGIPAPQKIGDLWARMKYANEADIRPLLGRLGVTETDLQAHKTLLPIIQKALGEDVAITASENEEDTGVFYLSTQGIPFAVFKVGEKRARMELLARHIAHKIGLEKHAIPGIFCSISNPILPNGETIVELWNGNQKVFVSRDLTDDNFGLETPPTLTGILEPYLSQEEVSLEEFTFMLIFALTSGLRDAKLSGIAGSTFFDTEECMPARLLPTRSPSKHVAATHLPYLEHPLAQEIIPAETLQKLIEKVNESSLSLFPFLTDLSKQDVIFPDLASEDLIAGDEELDDYDPHISYGWDHGGCYVKVEETIQILDDQPSSIYLKPKDPRSYRLLSDSQLDACATRITRLRDYLNRCIANCYLPTSIEIVRNVDLLYHAHLEALEKRKYDRQPLMHVVGRFTPSHSGVSDIESLPSYSGSSPISSPSSNFSRRLTEDSKEDDS